LTRTVGRAKVHQRHWNAELKNESTFYDLPLVWSLRGFRRGFLVPAHRRKIKAGLK